MKQRLKSKWLWTGAATLLYKALTEYFGYPVALEDYKLVVDLAAFALNGYAIYSDHSE
jgi:hypothetical protein